MADLLYIHLQHQEHLITLDKFNNMQTVYIGNTLVNDVMLGSNRMSDVISTAPSLVTSGLTLYFDAAYSASSTQWRAKVTPSGTALTASLSQTIYSTTPPQYLNFTGSASVCTYIAGPAEGALTSASLAGTGARTVMTFIYPKESSSLDNNIVWTGGAGDDRLFFQITSGSLNYLKIETLKGTTTQSVATQLGEIPYNQWNLVGYTTNGTNTYNGIDVWMNTQKQSLSGSTQWNVATTGTAYMEGSTAFGIKPYYGYVASTVVYNRKLTDSEWLQNYEYFQYRFGNI
jgi:hypothetical protein